MKTLLAGLSLVFVACATTPPADLQKARDEYQRAVQGPARALAPAELYQAQKMVTAANRSFEDTGDSLQTRDWSYVALRKIEIAEARARTAQQLQCAADDRTAARIMAEQQLEAARAAVSQAEERVKAEQELTAEERRRMEELAKVAQVKQDERGTVVTLPGAVLFKTGKAGLTSGAETQLTLVAKALEGRDSKIVIEGHTDNVGSMELNQNLSLARAASVADFLVAHGIERSRIETKGYGETRPLMDNTSPESRAANRRVEIVVQRREIPVG